MDALRVLMEAQQKTRVENEACNDRVEPFSVDVEHDPVPSHEDFLFRVRMTSSGADTPRLVVLRRKESGSEWFVWEYPGIVSGIRVPKAENPWA